MPRKPAESVAKKAAANYYVPPARKKAGGIVVEKGSGVAAHKNAPKYFTRTYPVAKDLPRTWTGKGPDLPAGYDGWSNCPDCNCAWNDPHVAICSRNPGAYDLSKMWDKVRVREQCFFGAGHPVIKDVDSYMTVERQNNLARAGYVVLYEVDTDSRYNSHRDVKPARIEQRRAIQKLEQGEQCPDE